MFLSFIRLQWQISQYGGYTLHDGGGSDPEPRLCLQLGLTDYRSFLNATPVNVTVLFSMFSDIDTMIIIL